MADTVASRLIEARQAKGWSLRELARRAGVDVSTLSHLETGHTEPSLRVVRQLAQALEVDPGWIAFGRPTSAPEAEPRSSGR